MPMTTSVDLHAAPPRPLAGKLVVQFLSPQVPWIVWGFGLLFACIMWVIAPPSAFRQAGSFVLPTARTQGRITRVDDTRVLGGDHGVPPTPIYAYHYRYRVRKRSYTGIAYGPALPQDIGAPLPVEYVTGTPAISRAPGLSVTPPGDSGLWLPGVGVLVLLNLMLWMTRRFRILQVLRHGIITEGTVTDLALFIPTMRQPDRRVFRIATVSFMDAEGAAQTTSAPTTLRPEQETTVLVCYLPQRPTVAIALFRATTDDLFLDDHDHVHVRGQRRNRALALSLPTLLTISAYYLTALYYLVSVWL